MWGAGDHKPCAFLHAFNPAKRREIAAGGGRRAEHTGAFAAAPSARAGLCAPIWQKPNAKLRVRRPSVADCGAAAGLCALAVERRPHPPTRPTQSTGNEALFSRLAFAQEVLPARRRPPRDRRGTPKAPSSGRSVAIFPRMERASEKVQARLSGAAKRLFAKRN